MERLACSALHSWEVLELGIDLGQLECLILTLQILLPARTMLAVLKVVLQPTALAAASNLLEMQILGPTPDLLSQELWRWASSRVVADFLCAVLESTLLLRSGGRQASHRVLWAPGKLSPGKVFFREGWLL